MLNKLKLLFMLIGLSVVLGICYILQTSYETDTPVKDMLTVAQNQNFKYQKIKETIQNTPKKTKVTFNTKEKELAEKHTYILFKFGCPNCEKVYNFLLTNYPSIANKNDKNISFVNVQSELGKYLIKHYKIQQASTLIYIESLNNDQYDVQSILDANNTINEVLLAKYLS